MPVPTDEMWNLIERAVGDPSELRKLERDIDASAVIPPGEKEHMLGRVQRYLHDHDRLGDTE